MLFLCLAGLFCWAGPLSILAQDGDVLLHDETYQFIDRLDIKGLTGQAVPTDVKPYGREQVAALLHKVDTARLGRRDHDWLLRTAFRMDDSTAREQPAATGWRKYLFTDKRDLLSYNSKAFRIYANLVLDFAYGKDQNNYPGAVASHSVYQNSRGGSLRGGFGKKLGFYAEIIENQQRFPQFITNRVKQYDVVPGAGFFKDYKNYTAYDFLTYKGYLTYSPVKSLRIKFGHDRAFWGNGSQSLQLSDYGTDYLLLNVTWRFWKLEYVTQFMEMVDFIRNKPDAYGAYPKKYGAMHQLSYRPVRQLSITVWDAVVMADQLPNGVRGFELSYLNPLIFYKGVEQSLGSPDNSLLGLNVKANILKQFQFYGQFTLDDYNVSASRQGKGYFGDKYAAQAGFKWIDALKVETLDLQAEFNSIRPYTYSHFSVASNYSHFGQFLAHPMGANLRELSLTANYQPIPRLYLYSRYGYVLQGLDLNGANYGGDIFRAGPPLQQYGNFIGQGQALTVNSWYNRITYQIFQQSLYLDLELLYRKENTGRDLSLFGALRYNIPWRPVLY